MIPLILPTTSLDSRSRSSAVSSCASLAAIYRLKDHDQTGTQTTMQAMPWGLEVSASFKIACNLVTYHERRRTK